MTSCIPYMLSLIGFTISIRKLHFRLRYVFIKNVEQPTTCALPVEGAHAVRAPCRIHSGDDNTLYRRFTCRAPSLLKLHRFPSHSTLTETSVAYNDEPTAQITQTSNRIAACCPKKIQFWSNISDASVNRGRSCSR